MGCAKCCLPWYRWKHRGVGIDQTGEARNAAWRETQENQLVDAVATNLSEIPNFPIGASAKQGVTNCCLSIPMCEHCDLFIIIRLMFRGKVLA
jgi:hypothetical protein